MNTFDTASEHWRKLGLNLANEGGYLGKEPKNGQPHLLPV